MFGKLSKYEQIMKEPGYSCKSRFFPIINLLLLLLFSTTLSAQQFPGGNPGGGMGAPPNIGRFYGKVVDEKGKGVGYATVELYAMRFDTVSRSVKETLITGQITKDNGDFSLEQLPVMGEFTLKVSFLGYAEVTQKVSFGLAGPGGGGRGNPTQANPGNGNGSGMAAMAGKFDKDLGNISLVSSSQTLQTVVVTAEASSLTLALDKKVFRMDKNAVATGGTAEDALRNIPSLAVDLDGNVTMRNAAPQIFVDGRPTTLTIDQIAADAIESVEVITNPSAKYDASGGQGGIVNIVLKKERRIGYNGGVRTGVDTRGGFNLGGDINAREGEVNAFISGNFNRRRSRGEGETDRQNFFGDPRTNFLQTSSNQMEGFFANARAGVDWFVDNRNTLTLAGSFTRGQFKPQDEIGIRTDSLFPAGVAFSEAVRNTANERNFRNLGGSMLFKHLFPKTGKEWTADLNYNRVTSSNEGNFSTSYDSGFQSRERQLGDGGNEFYTVQTDYVEPINGKMKIEAGLRAAIRNFRNNNSSFYFDPTEDVWIATPSFADRYSFNDAVYAAYASFSHQFPKWGYMAGLRVESSQYTGKLPESGTSFTNDYPLSLFPSVFVSRKLKGEDNVQLSYTRRINRPNFFQLMPFTDFSDSLNLQRGNPDLLPEFTNSLELSYQKFFTKGHNFLATVYYKQATDLITRFQFSEFNEELGREVAIFSYANSNVSEAYGVEFTLRNTFGKIIELTSNVNLYNSRVDASNVESGLINEQFTWFIKENLTVKLPAQFTLQISGEYRSRAAFSPSTGGGRFGGGHWGGPTNTAQGYTIANWFMDVALRKDLFNRKATLTLNVQDVLRTRRFGSFTESAFFTQDTWRVRDPQVARLNFSYRFGKMDASLFKRKNTRVNTEGMDLMQ